ncbi:MULTISPECIES: hypothetical protein [Methylomonas]|uniref:hypothetical protein n=1 Tax=Methylomonas TaxID=416 RepID=UPI000AEDAE63|nr:hypothetical protein [Methylomonas koyamae]
MTRKLSRNIPVQPRDTAIRTGKAPIVRIDENGHHDHCGIEAAVQTRIRRINAAGNPTHFFPAELSES